MDKDYKKLYDYILDNKELDITDVLLMTIVISLHKTPDGCYMSNDYICDKLRLKNNETASRRINKLEKLGYVELKYIPLPSNPKKSRRFIIPTYENGLTQKSSRVDSKVNTTLTRKSIPIDSKVNTPLTPKSTPPCLESQAIRLVDKITYKISELNKSEYINQLDNEKSVEEQLEQINLLISEDKFKTGDERGAAYFEKHRLEKLIKDKITPI